MPSWWDELDERPTDPCDQQDPEHRTLSPPSPGEKAEADQADTDTLHH